jgi:hypothetical protein
LSTFIAGVLAAGSVRYCNITCTKCLVGAQASCYYVKQGPNSILITQHDHQSFSHNLYTQTHSLQLLNIFHPGQQGDQWYRLEYTSIGLRKLISRGDHVRARLRTYLSQANSDESTIKQDLSFPPITSRTQDHSFNY